MPAWVKSLIDKLTPCKVEDGSGGEHRLHFWTVLIFIFGAVGVDVVLIVKMFSKKPDVEAGLLAAAVLIPMVPLIIVLVYHPSLTVLALRAEVADLKKQRDAALAEQKDIEGVTRAVEADRNNIECIKSEMNSTSGSVKAIQTQVNNIDTEVGGISRKLAEVGEISRDLLLAVNVQNGGRSRANRMQRRR